MNRNGFGLIGLLIALGIVAVLGGGTFYGYQGGFFDGTASSTITAPIDAANKAKELLEKNNQEIATDWKTYRNEEYGFSFEYPSNTTLSPIKKDDKRSYGFFPHVLWILTLSGKNTSPFDINLSISVPAYFKYYFATSTGKWVVSGFPYYGSEENKKEIEDCSVHEFSNNDTFFGRAGFGDGLNFSSLYVALGNSGLIGIEIDSFSGSECSDYEYSSEERKGCEMEEQNIKDKTSRELGHIFNTFQLEGSRPFTCLIRN